MKAPIAWMIVGVTLLAGAFLVASSYHVTCTPVPEGSRLESPCTETIPLAWVLAAAGAGLAGAVIFVVSAIRARAPKGA